MLTAEQLAEAKQMIDSAAASNGHTAPGMPAGWTAPAPVAASPWVQPAAAAAVPGPEKVLVPIKIPTPNGGSLRVYLQFPGELAANPQVMMAALAQLANVLPLDIWVPKNNGFGGGRGFGGGNGFGGGGNRGW